MLHKLCSSLSYFQHRVRQCQEGGSELSACVGSSMGDIIIRMLGKKKRPDSKKIDDGLSQCFNFKVIRLSRGGRENVSDQLSAAWRIQKSCRYLLIDRNRLHWGVLLMICIKGVSRYNNYMWWFKVWKWRMAMLAIIFFQCRNHENTSSWICYLTVTKVVWFYDNEKINYWSFPAFTANTALWRHV